MKRFLSILIASILVLCSAAVLAEGENLVNNGGFDDISGIDEGRPEGWTYHSYEEEYNQNIDNSFGICEPDGERGNVLHISAREDDDVAVYQIVTVEPDSFYRISCYIKTEGVEGGAGANIALREIIARSSGVFGDSDWQLVTLTGKTDGDQTSLVVSCRLGGYSAVSHGDAWFDAFRVEKLDGAVDEYIPFYSEQTEIEEDEPASTGAVILTVAVLLLAVAACVAAALLIFRKRGGDGASPLPSPESYADDKARALTGMEAVKGRSFFNVNDRVIPGPTDIKLHFTKRDRIYIVVLTVVYGVIALLRLGTLNFPTSYWSGMSGDSVHIDFGRSVELSDIWQVSGISHTKYTITTDNGEEIAFSERSGREYGHMFRWASLNKSDTEKTSATTGVTLTIWGGDDSRPKEADLVLLELAFFDRDGNRVEFTADKGAEALCDEQDTIPAYSSYMTGMYFDELYHGRTALENINNSTVYEWTHPPLGKLIIAIGILIFGMKPFGWRVMGVLFGIAMVPVMYCFGKRLLKRSELALFSAFIFTFDFMHFTQTRIATIDVYGVFFILLMTYFMYNFICMDIGDDLKSMMKQLALSGIFFGLGCASKWIDIYTGAALALMFFVKLILMGRKSYKLSKLDKYKNAGLVKKFWRRAAAICCWCVIFFVLIPAVIYSASYFRYYTSQWKPDKQTQIYKADADTYSSPDEVKLTAAQAIKTYVSGVINNQKSMYSYHSALKSEHSAASPWWMWLLDLRPTWFYVGGTGNPKGYVGTISTFGNPAVWVLCTFATIVLAILTVFRKKRFTTESFFLFVCMASSFLPWVLVTRSTYAYHFFATVPYITLAAGYLLKHFEDADEEKRKAKHTPAGIVPKIKYIWMVLVLVLFIVFYPVISGLEVPREYVAALQWVPFHKIEVQNAEGEVLHTYRIGWRFTDYEPGNLKPSQITVIKRK